MFNLPNYVIDFINIFKKNCYQIFIVGGAVRDLLLKKNQSDKLENWDFATNATPGQILKMFPEGFYNNQFGTVGIEVKTNKKKLIFEITTFRKEFDYDDLRHPKKIEWAKTIEEDLARRDFTINAIAYDGKKLIDPYHGQKHVNEKLIVTVGNSNHRFSEDALRLLRAVRFSAELGFIIEEKTRNSIIKNSQLITKISWERIRDEFFKILASDNPAEGILFMKNTGLLAKILPELDVCFIIPQKSPKRHHIYDVGTHSIMALKNCPSKDIITRFAVLLHDIGKATTFKKDHKTDLITFYNHEVVGTKLAVKIADRFKLSKEQKNKFILLIKYHQFTVSETQTDKAIRRFIRELGKNNLQNILDLRTGDRIGSGASPTSWRLELFRKRLEQVQKEPFKITDLKIDGYDVMKILALKPGPKIGEVLKTVFNDVINKRINNERQELLDKLRRIKKRT